MAIIRLGDIFVKKPQYGLNKRAEITGNIKYLTQSTININYDQINLYVNLTSEEINNYILKKDDILLTRAGTIDSYYKNDDNPIVFAGYIVRYYFDNKILLNKYFYLWTKSSQGSKEIKKISNSGTTMPKLNPNFVKNILINIPSIQEQRKIIDIIEPKEDLYKKYSNIINIDSYDSFIKSWSVLIDIIEPFERLKDKNIKLLSNLVDVADKYHNNNVIKINSQKLNDEFKVDIGKTPSTKNINFWNKQDYKWINSGQLTNNITCINETKFISEEGKKSKNLFLSDFGDILMSIMEPSINKIAISNGRFAYNQSTCCFYGNKNKISSLFFDLRRNIKEISNLSHGSAQKSVNKSQIENLDICVYEDRFLDNIYLLILKLHKSVEILNQIISNLSNIFIK